MLKGDFLLKAGHANNIPPQEAILVSAALLLLVLSLLLFFKVKTIDTTTNFESDLRASIWHILQKDLADGSTFINIYNS